MCNCRFYSEEEKKRIEKITKLVKMVLAENKTIEEIAEMEQISVQETEKILQETKKYNPTLWQELQGKM